MSNGLWSQGVHSEPWETSVYTMSYKVKHVVIVLEKQMSKENWQLFSNEPDTLYALTKSPGK